MFCPRCSHLSLVLRTIKLSSPNKVIRTRQCPSCGYYFCSQETLDIPNSSPVEPASCLSKASPPSRRLPVPADANPPHLDPSTSRPLDPRNPTHEDN